MIRDPLTLPLALPGELIVDNFAGGGGASTGIERAFGRPVDIAINHDPQAVAMHAINHPHTRHFCESVWQVNPREVATGPVGLVWLSPDCKHFSKAKGGTPVEKHIRGLAWVALRWAATVKPRVIMLENVEEFKDWGPLVAQPDGTLRPCPRRKGREFNAFTNALRRQGYAVEYRELRACDYGAPTIRKRLFMVARRDGRPIVWPTPTHGDPASAAVLAGKLLPWRTAAECIDWSLPCPSIFERTRPLAEATLRRIARGIMRYVIEAAEPFIVGCGGRAGQSPERGVDKPFQTITAKADACIVVPTLIQTGYGERPGQAPRAPGLGKPLGTIVSGQKHALVAAFLAKHYGGPRGGYATGLDAPISTITAVDHHALVTSHIVKLRGDNTGHATDEPLHTISAQGNHLGEVRAFLIKYYGNEREGVDLHDPMHTVTARDRFGLVTVAGQDYAIADIGMRMLQPRELFDAQGFPHDYIIDFDYAGKPLPKDAKVRMCGNSVSPPVAEALVRANFAHEAMMPNLQRHA